MRYLLAFALIVLTACTATTVDVANAPAVGDIWFGSAFDPETLELSGRTQSISTTAPFVIVAHIPEELESTDLLIRTYYDDQLVGTTPSNAQGSGDFWGFNIGPLGEAGTWRYELTDIGGNVLASGEVEAQ